MEVYIINIFLSSFDNKCIVGIFWIGEEKGRVFLVLGEFVGYVIFGIVIRKGKEGYLKVGKLYF